MICKNLPCSFEVVASGIIGTEGGGSGGVGVPMLMALAAVTTLYSRPTAKSIALLVVVAMLCVVYRTY